MPNVSCSTLATGARQLVVQLAFEMHFMSLGQLVVVDAQHDGQVGLSPWPGHSAPLAWRRRPGASRSPACLSVFRAVKTPVLSITTSTPRSPQGSSAGLRSSKTRIFLPLTIRFSSS